MPVLLATVYSAELMAQGDSNFTVVAKPYDATLLAQAISVLLDSRDVEAD